MEGGPVDPTDEVLVDRFVPFIDELAEAIAERGDEPLAVTMASALKDIPPSQRQRVMFQEMLRYREAVEKPAADALRHRKAFFPSAVEKVSYGNSHRDALDGVETRLVHVTKPPQISHLALRVSWPPDSVLRSFPPCGLIINSNRNILLMYVGPYRPGLGSQGFYLVYDCRANSVAVIPPVPLDSVPMFSHSSIGTGAAVLHYGPEYLVVELFLQRNNGCISNKATLLMWWSDRAGHWTQREVMLPLPSEPEEHTSRPSYTFCADLVFPVGNKGLCWADLLLGVLVCDDISAAQPQFQFLPVPGYIKAGIDGRGEPRAHRSMCGVEYDGNQFIKFVTVDGYGQSQDHSCVTIKLWTLSVVKTSEWRQSFVINYGSLLADPLLKLHQLMPTFPIISMVDDGIVYITGAADLESMNGRPEDRGRYVLSIDMERQSVLSSFKLPTASGRIPTNIFASTFISYLNKKSPPSEAQRKRKERTGSSSFPPHGLSEPSCPSPSSSI
ncbi:hypothetical protein EJB05_48101 [Eragrostis curvula]|uniref:DUF1618 domain-containing protein n=1 Tax=Eragrostis curvula TaxID=38414 RepID=A0A5J9T0U4_9POAL|nr:hypothetical protein EJB05_48101 [Eragrostis curvula]